MAPKPKDGRTKTDDATPTQPKRALKLGRQTLKDLTLRRTVKGGVAGGAITRSCRSGC